MSGYMTHELQLKVTGADGTVLWVGSGPLGMIYEVTMVSQVVTPGLVICAQGANCVIPRQDYVAADTVPKQHLRGVIGTAVVTLGPTLGVAIENCGSDAAGVQIRVAGPGSIVAAQYNAGTNALGDYLIRAAAGKVDGAAAVTARIGVGFIAKVSNITGGSGNNIGALVQPL